MGVHLEALLAVGYAVFLLGVALGLDLLARHSHVRSECYRTAGFAYHPTHDAWICPRTTFSCGARWIASGGWSATGGGPKSATTARPRPSARTPTRDGRSCGPWTLGPTPRLAGSIAGPHSPSPSW